jgi:hypothetical protein
MHFVRLPHRCVKYLQSRRSVVATSEKVRMYSGITNVRETLRRLLLRDSGPGMLAGEVPAASQQRRILP